MVAVDEKEWWQSKTVWFNVAFLVLSIVGVVLKALGYDEFTPDSNVAEVILVLIPVINLVLRLLFTKKQIRLR